MFIIEKSRELLDIFKRAEFQNIFIQKHVVEINVSDHWKIVVLLTANTLPVLPSEHCEGFGLSFGGYETTEFGRNIVVPNMVAYEHLAMGRSMWLPKSHSLTGDCL